MELSEEQKHVFYRDGLLKLPAIVSQELVDEAKKAGNASASIRYGIFFRLWHTRHDEFHWECMTDIWKEWAGMQTSVQKEVSSHGRR